MLEFLEPDTRRFPCLRLAYDALRQGSSYPCALNAADEVAVGAFLERKISFGAIPRVIEETLNSMAPAAFRSIDDVLEYDRTCRQQAAQLLHCYQT